METSNDCGSNLIEAVFLNSIIVNEILGNFDSVELHSKQHVCRLWKDVVSNLLRKQENLLFVSHHFYNGSVFENEIINNGFTEPQSDDADDAPESLPANQNVNSVIAASASVSSNDPGTAGGSKDSIEESDLSNDNNCKNAESEHQHEISASASTSASGLKRMLSLNNVEDQCSAKKRKLESPDVVAKQGPDNFIDSFLKWKRTWKHKPLLILISYQVPSDTGFNSVQNNCWRTKSKQFKRIHSMLTQHLPPKCKLVFSKGLTRQLSMLNLINSSNGFTVSDSITMQYVLADSLLFSSVKPLEILSIPSSQFTSTTVKDTVDELLSKMVSFLENKTDVKLFMFFLDTYCFGGHLSLAGYQELLGKMHLKLQSCLSQHKDMVVICSTTKDPVMYTQMMDHSKDKTESNGGGEGVSYLHEYGSFFALCFCGPSVSAASVYLNDSVKTRHQVTDKLKVLKDSLENSKAKSSDSVLAIKTSGYLRMCNVYSIFTEDDSEGDPEETVFKSVFPGVKLLTFNGIGALGGDFNVGDETHFDSFSIGSRTSSLIRPEMNSTVFSIVRFSQ